jgi:hypothetical protein
MTSRIRHCVECPKCCTRYLVGFSPYPNGSYMRTLLDGFGDEWILYCTCVKPATASLWKGRQLNLHVVSRQAYGRGYGSPEEIVRARLKSAR